VSERGGPFTTDSFNWLVKRAGRSIQDYLGHKNIMHTVRYTELSPTRFKDFWRD
jgi:hypothetical protein